MNRTHEKPGGCGGGGGGGGIFSLFFPLFFFIFSETHSAMLPAKKQERFHPGSFDACAATAAATTETATATAAPASPASPYRLICPAGRQRPC